MRSVQLLGLDADAVQLAVVGLVRRVAQEPPPGAGAAWLGDLRGVSFADGWLAFSGSPTATLQVPVDAVLRALAFWAADLVLEAHHGDAPQALAWLGQRSAEACEEQRGAAHPAEPVALAMVWYGLKAPTAGGELTDAEHGEVYDGRMAARYKAYIRDKHHRQDVLALLLTCARIAATALLQLSDGEQWQVQEHLEERATRFMPPAGPAASWVPHDPAYLTGRRTGQPD